MNNNFWNRVSEHEKEGFLKDFRKEYRLKDKTLSIALVLVVSLNLICSTVGLGFYLRGELSICLVPLVITALFAWVLFVLFIYLDKSDKEDPMLSKILKDEISNYIFNDDNRRHDFLNSRAEKHGRFRFRDA